MLEMRSEYDILFNNGVFPVIISDFNNESILKVNNVFTEWFRQTDPDISVLTINGDRIQVLEEIRSFGICESFSLSVLHKNGKKIECLATASIGQNRDGKDEIVIIIHESLEDKKKTAFLKKRSANLYALSENMELIFWSVDSDLKLVNYNSRFVTNLKRSYGISIKTGDNIINKLPDQLITEWTKRYDRALKGKKTKYTDDMLGGTVETSFIPIFSEEESVIGICCTINDITEKVNAQKNLEVIHKRFSNILNSSTDAAIIATDPQGIIRQFNSGASVMLGYDQQEVIGKSSIIKFFPRAFIADLKSLIYSKKGVTVHDSELCTYFSNHPELINKIEWFFEDKYGHIIDIKISLSSVLMNQKEFAGNLMIAQDITELNRVKEELEEAKLQAEEISRTKTSFLANMSHEIRTPLNGIIGMTDLLKGTELSPVQENYSSIIFKSANTLLLLINDILDYSKIEAAKLKLEFVTFNLRSLMNDLKDILLINIKERNIDYDIWIDESVSEKLIGDPRRIKQILLNLVGNALKFTLKGFIKIEIFQISEIDNDITLYFKVIDSGIGISSEEKIKLFKTFSQVDISTTRKYGGTGLGLAISKELVSMMDGEIGVISNKSEGSTFWFTIKLKKEVETYNNRILIANSNRVTSKVLVKNLNNLGLEIIVAENGEKCLKILKEYHKKGNFFDLAIINETLSDSNGNELAKKIKEIAGLQKIKLIKTFYSNKEDVLLPENTDFHTFLQLPTSQKLLQACLEEILNVVPSISETDETASTAFVEPEENNEDKIKVLVAEDNKINQLVAMNFLKKLGYHAELVENGQDAVNAHNSKFYDLILMDQMMPVMDGIEATKQIRASNSEVSNKEILIIALTANAMKGDREVLLNAGMDDYISKPVLLKDIKAVLEKNLKSRNLI